MSVSERLGEVAGVLLAPPMALGGLLRRARLFHPVGRTWSGRAHPVAVDPASAKLADALTGPALVRTSGGVWKRSGLPDVLGLAIRFHDGDGPPVHVGARDQDLILATMHALAVAPADVLLTRSDDYLANTYRSLARFRVDGVGPVRFRAIPLHPSPAGPDREVRLDRAVAQDLARFRIELRRLGERAWRPVVELALLEPVEVDQAALRFSPQHDGRGIEAVGWINEVRRFAYPSGQAGRHLSEPG